MRQSRSLSGVVIALFAAVAALVVLVFVVLLVSVINLRDDTHSGRRTTDLLIASYGADVALGEVSSSLRGWLIHPSSAYAADFKQAESSLASRLGTLRVLALGASERGRVVQLTAAVNRYVANYANPVAKRGPGLSEAAEAAAVMRGTPLFRSLGRQFSALDAIELAARQARRDALATEASRTITIAAIGLVGSVLLLAVLGAYVLRWVLRPIRSVAEALDRRGGGDTTVRVTEHGRGEVAMLERSFNQMAEQLDRTTKELSEANQRLEHAVVEAQEASRMKSEFLANMSHEIRTPLNGVVGMVSLLSGTKLNDEQREYVEMARSASDTLIGIVTDVLDVSKIEAGRLEIEHHDFDLHELIRAARDMFVQQAGRKGLALRARIAEDVPRAVRGDRLRTGQVLGNLLANAVKFTDEGEVSLSATVSEHTNLATIVRFEVRDSGIGIANEQLEQLFDPFVQADASTTRQFGGTGLGLTISRDLARLMGGTISAHSEPGAGSAFEVELPFAPAAGVVPPVPPTVELQGLRILVVDDNAANRRILETYVGSWGMRATSAPDAAQALSELDTAADTGEPFDVALLDFNMPNETGVELARRISASPRLRGTRLILISSADDSSAELKSEGIRQRLTKPISRSSLLDAIAAAMHSELASDGSSLPDAVPDGARGAAPATVAAATAGARILVAEDNTVNQMYVERLLTRRGYLVTTAANGREVLGMLDERDFDLILMDCQMPELDGYDTTREIRRREAATRGPRIPIVAMTAAATDEIRGRCLDAGMDDYMSKPLGDEELDQALRRGLGVNSRAGGLDANRLARLRELFDDDDPGSVLVRIGDEVVRALDQAHELAESGDRAGVARAAHAIRGSAEMIGATSLVDAAGALERRASAGDGLHEGLQALTASWEQTHALLRAEVAADRAGMMRRTVD